jgi:biopolymer transport protein ExbD
MTPMIDITFLLLTFFMLASHFASVERVDLELPQPEESQAVDRRFPEKVIVNVLYAGEDKPAAIQLGPVAVSLTELGDRLERLAGHQGQRTQVILRADRRLPYSQVRNVMEIIAATRLTKLQVVAELERSS